MSATETIPGTDALRLVPVEPTKAMLAAGQAAGDYGDALRRAWSAMLSAAPTVPLSTPMGGEVEALREASGCFEAAFVEGWIEALAEGDIERIRDLWERRISWAASTISEALSASSPSPAQGGVTVAVQPVEGK